MGSNPARNMNISAKGSLGSLVPLYPKSDNPKETLSQLIEQIRKYDAVRVKLEQEGGKVSDLGKINEILCTDVKIMGIYGEKSVPLRNPAKIREAVKNADWELHIEIRSLPTHMPVYYICRIKKDFWSEYSLVVEDIYMSPGYPIDDERFVKLMDSCGHEVFFIRLSRFRDGISKMKGIKPNNNQSVIDTLLYDLGRHVFQAAWHEDQRCGILVARHLGLQKLHDAIEILYLCLSGELCQLRGAVASNATIKQFFEDVYVQPAIWSLLEMMFKIEGGTLTELPRKAAHLYKKLSRAFSGFLLSETTWGYNKVTMPVWKLLYANFTRLDLICSSLMQDNKITPKIQQLEREAGIITRELLSTAGSVQNAGIQQNISIY